VKVSELRRRGLVVVSSLLVLSACAPGNAGTPEVEQTVQLPGAEWTGAAWTTDQTLLLQRIEPSGPAGTLTASLWTASPGSGKLIRFSVPMPAGCGAQFFTAFEPLRGGRLAAVRSCGSFSGREDAVAITSSGTVQTLAADLKDGSGHVVTVSSLSWNPDVSEAVASVNTGICGTLFSVSPQAGAQPIQLSLGSANNRWNTAADFTSPDPVTCGSAFDGEWSPDGNQVTFFTDPRGRSDATSQRLDADYSLMAVSSTFGQLTPILTGLRYPSSMRWSPDGRRLAISAQIGGVSGTWAYDRVSKQLRQLSSLVGASISWSPQGTRLAIDSVSSQGSNGLPVTSVHIVPVPAPA
jgi:dipeptidyl aminopeptidase/acylaminoacyl peptidase